MSGQRFNPRRGNQTGRPLSPFPFAAGLAIGLALLLLSGAKGGLSDVFFCLGSGMLLAALLRTLSNLRAFASFSWGVRMVKRLFRGEAKSGREETEDYARYRESLGGHADAPLLWIAAALLLALAALTARFA
ncbi:MAG: DUF3899 domain-containing protein [Clostridia bacterium]|nr:DUF3899 domain-containing protein [Clostridia bacterium]